METAKPRAILERWSPYLAGMVVAGLFLYFTRHAPFVYFSHDDLMNLDGYWSRPFSLWKGLLFFWEPYYRPIGALVYRGVFARWGLHPRPLYAIYYATLFFNLGIAYLLFKSLSASREIAGIAMLLFAFHGKLASLYYSAGAMYDVFCFLFFCAALTLYARVRNQGRLPGLWQTLGVLACQVLALDSKEMAVTLPAILLLYELLFHPPDFRGLARWCVREGRTALLAGLCVVAYLPARLAGGGIAHLQGYVPSFTLTRWLEDAGLYLAYAIYRNDPSREYGVVPFGPLGIAVFCAVLAAIALWARSRVVWFGLLFFWITLLPVAFIAPRLGFVLYLPFAGLTLAAAACLVRLKAILCGISSKSPSPRAASIALFAVTALAMVFIDRHYAPPAPRAFFSPFKKTLDQISGLYPALPRGARLLFVHTPIDGDWDMSFLLRLYYRDTGLFITQLNGRPEQRIAIERLPHYDHVLDFENGRYVELDNTDPPLSIQLHLLKAAVQTSGWGECMIAGAPAARRYIVKDVLASGSPADGYWTLDRPVLQFRLSSVQHDMFREHFYLPSGTLKQTGPLLVDFHVNGLCSTRRASPMRARLCTATRSRTSG